MKYVATEKDPNYVLCLPFHQNKYIIVIMPPSFLGVMCGTLLYILMLLTGYMCFSHKGKHEIICENGAVYANTNLMRAGN